MSLIHKNIVSTCVLAALLGIVMLLSSSQFIAHAAPLGVTISPAVIEKQVKSGENYSQSFSLTNTSDQPVVVYTTVRDFTSKDDSGAASYVEVKDSDMSFSISKWISLNDSIPLSANETKQLTFTIQVPEKAGPGGHYGTIFFQPRQEIAEGKENAAPVIRTNALIGMHVILTVDGILTKKLALQHFSLTKDTSITDEGVSFDVVVKNTGNVHLSPKGRIEIYDAKGSKLTNIGKLMQKDKSGNIFNEVPVDFIPFNQQESKALPDQERRISEMWHFDETHTPEGTFKAKYIMDYEVPNDEQISKEISLTIKKEMSISGVQVSPWVAMGGPIQIKAMLKNTGTMALGVKAKVILYNLFGGEMARSDVPLEGMITPNEERNVQTSFTLSGWSTLLYTPTLMLTDKYGNSIGKGTTLSFYAPLPEIIIAGVAVLLLLFVIFLVCRKWCRMKKETSSLQVKRRRK